MTRGVVLALLALVSTVYAAEFEDEVPYRPTGPWFAMVSVNCPAVVGLEYQLARLGCRLPVGNQGLQCSGHCLHPGDPEMPWNFLEMTNRMCVSACYPRDSQFRLVLSSGLCNSGKPCIRFKDGSEGEPVGPFFYPSVFCQEHVRSLSTRQFGPGDGSCTYSAPPSDIFPGGLYWTEHLVELTTGDAQLVVEEKPEPMPPGARKEKRRLLKLFSSDDD